MILEIQDVWTAIDKGYDAMAQIQLIIAKKSRTSGDTTVYDKNEVKSMRLYSNILALEELSLNHTITQNATIKQLYNNIKLITKDYRQWD